MTFIPRTSPTDLINDSLILLLPSTIRTRTLLAEKNRFELIGVDRGDIDERIENHRDLRDERTDRHQNRLFTEVSHVEQVENRHESIRRPTEKILADEKDRGQSKSSVGIQPVQLNEIAQPDRIRRVTNNVARVRREKEAGPVRMRRRSTAAAQRRAGVRRELIPWIGQSKNNSGFDHRVSSVD